MPLRTIEVVDFRCFTAAAVELDPDVTVLRGANGTGKTSVLEAIAWLATFRSFRGAAREVMVRNGADAAVIRAVVHEPGRGDVLLEAELPTTRPARYQANRQRVRGRREIAPVLRVSTFSPDDLELVQGSPSRRREFLDDTLINRHPRSEDLVAEVDRILRQRAALLRQAPRGGVEETLDVWDDRLAKAGSALAEARENLVKALSPAVMAAYDELAGERSALQLRYRRSWEGGLLDALRRQRQSDLARQVTTVGPHRDELEVTLDGIPVRTQASQGEQRTTALALRLGAHQLVRDDQTDPPILLLDDVFSELDEQRARALVEQLPGQQVVLATASPPPPLRVGRSLIVPDDLVAVVP